MLKNYVKQKTTLVTALAACSLGALALPAVASEIEGCQSAPILEKFEEFGKTGKMPRELGAWLGNAEAQYVEPYKAFDNVNYVGICWVSAWTVNTSEGTVLIDTLYGPFVDVLLDNLKKMNVDLADIKYVLMTHGHFDHVGGADKLKALLPNARFVMTEEGYEEAEEGAAKSQGGRRAWSMIDRDIVVKDGDEITLGDSTFTVYETPGHTHGTASYGYTVKDGDNSYQAFTVGGLGLNAIEGPSQVEDFIHSIDKISELVQGAKNPLQVHLSTHGFSNNLPETAALLAKRGAGDPHPMVDPEAFQAQLDSLREGAVKRLAIEKSK
nr:MBL fold metallo-hydrolase [Marinomonas algicola]